VDFGKNIDKKKEVSQTYHLLAKKNYQMLHLCVFVSVFTRDSWTGRYCWQHVLAILSVRLSVRLSVCPSRPGTDLRPGEIETPGLHHMVA